MTPQEALAEALTIVEEQKLRVFLDEELPALDTAIGCGDAAAILAALPDGWELIRGHCWEPGPTYTTNPLTETRVCRGCGRRERLRTPEWVED